MHPPATSTFDPINRHATLPRSRSTSTSISNSSVSQPSDLAHVASIVQGLVAMVQPAPHPAPSTPNNKSNAPSAPSPPRNTPSKLSRFLEYAEESLGVHGATAYEETFRNRGYGPDILHLVDGTTLQGIGLSEGDVIRLKQNSLHWWNIESESKKRKRPDEDSGRSTHPTGPSTPPNIKVRFEKRFHNNGGSARLYGPRITPGRQPPGQDFDWAYFCEARGRFVPLPDNYIPILDGMYVEQDQSP
jgi:hypothetical protein